MHIYSQKNKEGLYSDWKAVAEACSDFFACSTLTVWNSVELGLIRDWNLGVFTIMCVSFAKSGTDVQQNSCTDCSKLQKRQLLSAAEEKALLLRETTTLLWKPLLCTFYIVTVIACAFFKDHACLYACIMSKLIQLCVGKIATDYTGREASRQWLCAGLPLRLHDMMFFLLHAYMYACMIFIQDCMQIGIQDCMQIGMFVHRTCACVYADVYVYLHHTHCGIHTYATCMCARWSVENPGAMQHWSLNVCLDSFW